MSESYCIFLIRTSSAERAACNHGRYIHNALVSILKLVSCSNVPFLLLGLDREPKSRVAF